MYKSKTKKRANKSDQWFFNTLTFFKFVREAKK